MRELLPHPAVAVDLHGFYGRDWDGPGGLRVNFVSAVDGGAAVEGKSGGLQTPGDNRVFAALRDLADVVLVGSGTAIAEGYKPASPSGDRLAARRTHGFADTLPIAVVSNSLRLDPRSPLFNGPRAPTVVLTCAAAPRDRRAALADVAEVIDCGDEQVDPAIARAELHARGHNRILCEGGPSLFASFAAAGVVDELCLSLSPMLAGPAAARIMGGDEPWPAGPLSLALTGLLEDDGALFLRYALAR